MKTIKIILLFAFNFTFFISIQAQTDANKKGMCNSLMKATYVFEGKIDSGKYLTVKTGEDTHANFISYIIEINKVLKGNIQKGTIEILISVDGIIHKKRNTTSLYSSEKEDGPPKNGIYFCYDTIGTAKTSYYKNSNNKTIQFREGISLKDGKIQSDTRGGISLYFSTLTDFYAYLSENYEVKIEQ